MDGLVVICMDSISVEACFQFQEWFFDQIVGRTGANEDQAILIKLSALSMLVEEVPIEGTIQQVHQWVPEVQAV